jgi:hypothetical protein
MAAAGQSPALSVMDVSTFNNEMLLRGFKANHVPSSRETATTRATEQPTSPDSILLHLIPHLACQVHPTIMGETRKIVDTLEHGKNPNFLLVVVLSAVALIGLFIVIWILVGDKGKKLLPGLHHDPQPTSSIRRQVSRTIPA